MLYDAIVVGAGPSGAIVGEKIAREGFDVLIIEKAESPGQNKICGGAISQNCFKDLRLPEKIIEKKGFGITLNFIDEKKFLRGSGFVIVEREIFDDLLVKKAVDKDAELLTSTTVFDVVKNKKSVKVRFRKNQKNQKKEVSAKFVVFADGTNTLAYSKFNIGYKAEPNSTALALAYNLEWRNNPYDSLEFFFSENISPFGYGWIFPKKDSINIGVLCLLSKIEKNLNKYLNAFIDSLKLQKLKRISFGARLIPQSIPKKIFVDSVLVVGDAAGTADPITGGGISNAIENGKVAAKIVLNSLSKNISKASLFEYNEKWQQSPTFMRLQKNYQLQKITLNQNIIPGFLLNELGFFN